MKLAKMFKMQVAKEKGGKEGRGLFSESSRKWEGMVELFCGLVGDVGVDDGMFDGVVEVLGSVVWERGNVRDALSREKGNADAVWLVCLNKRQENVTNWQTPVMEGYSFVDVDVVG